MRTIVGFVQPPLRTLTPDLVQAAADQPAAFADYVQQTIGVPWPTIRDMKILRSKIDGFFTLYPHTDYRTLCRIVMFMQSRKRRVPRTWMVVEEFRKAWAAGQLPELDPDNMRDETTVLSISDALTTEHDPVWRRRLLLAQGASAQQEVLAAWRTSR
jgi:hypothetical protein